MERGSLGGKQQNQIKISFYKKLLRCEPFSRIEKSFIKAICIIGLGGFMFGYDISIVAGGLDELDDYFGFGTLMNALVVSMLSIGSAVGAIFAGPVCDSIGRWRTCQLQVVLFIIGSLLISAARYMPNVLAGRFILGLATAFAVVGSVPYLNEISPAKYRGRFQGAFELCVVIGMFISTVANLLAYNYSSSWRFTFGVPILIAGTQSLLLWMLPESPSFLVQKGNFDEATIALDSIYRDPEMVQIEMSNLRLMNVHKINGRFETFLKMVRLYSPSLLVIIGLVILQSLSGVIVLSTYAPMIFRKVGYSEQAGLLMTLVIGAVRVIFTVLAIFRIDSKKWGRKQLLTRGVLIMIIGYFGLIATFIVYYFGNSSVAKGFLLPCCCVLVAGHSLGYGIISRVLQAEFFPTLIRSRGLSITLIVQSIVQGIILFSFPFAIDGPQLEDIFILYVALTLAGLLYIRKVLPDTNVQDPAQILNEIREKFKSFSCCKKADSSQMTQSILDIGSPVTDNMILNDSVQSFSNNYEPPSVNYLHRPSDNRTVSSVSSNGKKISMVATKAKSNSIVDPNGSKNGPNTRDSSAASWEEMNDTDEYFA